MWSWSLASALAAAPADEGQPLREVALPPEAAPLADRVGFTVAEGGRGLLSDRALAEMHALGFDLEVLRPDHVHGPPPLEYRSPEEGGAILAGLASHERAGLVQIGESVEGRPLEALWVGQPPDQGAPVVRVLGAHHGDEWSSFEVALSVAEELVARDGVDPGVTALLDTTSVQVAPYVNPDGVAAGSRYNHNEVDLNRNYDFEWGDTVWRAGEAPFSEPETRAVRTWALSTLPMLSLSMHSGATNLGYVWNWSDLATPEEPLLEELGAIYDASCEADGFYVTNGADWYETQGDTNDWSYGRYGGMDFTLELTSDKTPEPDAIEAFVDDHLEAVLALLVVPPTLSGRVVDAGTGDAIPARVDYEGVRFYADASGAFHRIATRGPTTLTVSSPGFVDTTVRVDVGTTDAASVEVTLQRADLATSTIRPSIVSGPSTIALPGGFTGTVRFEQFGYPIETANAVQGVITELDLPPGPWSVRTDDRTWARGLVVTGGGSATADTVAVADDGSGIDISGHGFGPGSRAWSIRGHNRALTALAVTSESISDLQIDGSALPAGVNFDLMVLSNGTWMAFDDLQRGDNRSIDPSSPDDGGVPELVRAGGCGCAPPTGPAGPGSIWGLLLISSIWRRRR